MLSSADGDLATLWFKPLENVIAPILDAEVVINTKTYDVLKVLGTVVNDHLEFIKFKEKNTFIKNYQLSYEMVFKKTSNQELLIDYIKIDHSFDYYRDDAFLTHVISTSDLTFFEQYKPDNSRRIRNKFWRKSDWEALNKIGYNEAFWRNNPIVKRTPVEEEVITSFEKDNAFESIFLNTKEQISFMQSNLRGDLFIENFDGLLRKYNNYNPVEKVFLHTDKNVFVAGETVWYKAYVVLGEYHQFSLGSKVLHVDLIDSNNKIILSQTHKIVEGHAQGYLELPSNLQTGDYQLRAYTNWMRNFDQDFFFTKNIKLLNKDNDKIEKSNSQEAIDLQFFPEGGYAVSGISGKITFKAIGSDGLGRDVKGQIKNSKGKTVLSINSMYKGMGFFSLKPEANETYTAILDDGLKFDLPQIQDKGYVMVVDNLNTRNIKVKVQASNELRNKPFYIIGTMNNNKQYQGRFKFNTESVIDFEIPKSKLASGVLTLTLFDEQMRPWCERAIFINNKNELTIEAGLSKSDFNKRGKFELKVHIKDSYGAPLSTKFSVAVTDADKVEKDNKDANILTHLLLQSDIKGHVENSGYYFSDDKRSTAAKLDLVMLTHGWRKFNWEELDKIDFNSLKEFPFERGYTISGIATNMQDVPLKNKALKMIGKSKDELKLYTTTTNNDGSFRIENVDNSGSVELAFNAYNTKDEAINTKVVLVDKNKEIELPVPNFKNHKGGSYNSKAMPFFVYEDAQILDEVLVNAKNKIIEKPKYASSLYHVEPDNTILADNNRNGNILYHIADVSGIDVVFLSNQVVIRGNSYGPLWVIDGMTLREPNADLKVPDYIYGMDMSNVERIEIIKSAYKAAVYGPSGKYGVIAIYTKTGKLKQDNSFTSKHSINGFSKFKEFYSPKYDVDINMSDYSDNRTTLYWNPSVKTDKDGNATIIFYNSDITNSIEVDVQALSEYGAPGAYLSTFKEK
ncbi:MG2 domain-containing protein [Pontimicrobium aquaticum]|nr:TonB-dependent receptor plug domain-containing protein [Pontimicrobium aquaticum]